MARSELPPSHKLQAMREPMDVRFENISYHVTPRKSRPLLPPKALPPVQILHSISGHVPAGESLAILGPSGCGKTSLLDILAARSEVPPSAGRVTFSGRPRHPRTKRDIGYVMQDDVFLSQLTVRQTMDFTAAVRLPARLSAAERAARVEHVLARLCLTKCQDVRIGSQSLDKGISGGERKRLNIANELLHEPSLLLVDECTSGLDSSSAYTVIKFLSELCQEGRTVVVTIHQPSSQMFNMFDRIMLLAAGRVAYFGPAKHMVRYFEAIDFPFPKKEYNPADYALELVIDKADHASDEATVPARILDEWQQRGPQVLGAITAQHPSSSGMRSADGGTIVGTTTLSKSEPCAAHSIANGSSEDNNRANGTCNENGDGKHVVVPVQEIEDTLIGGGDAHSTDHKTNLSASERAARFPPVATTTTGRMQRAASKRVTDLTGQRGHDGVSDKYPTSWWQQVRELSRRAFHTRQGIMTEVAQIVQVVAMVVTISVLWKSMRANESTIEDRLGLLSFVIIFWMFYSGLNALYTFPPERSVLNKDRASGTYRLSAYFISKLIVELPADTIYPIISSSISYYIIDFNKDVRAFLLYLTVVVLNSLVAQSMGLFVSAAILNLSAAKVVLSIWMQTNLATAGYLVNPNNMPWIIRALRQVNFLRISYETLIQIELSFGRTYACNEPPMPPTEYSNSGVDCPITKGVFIRAAQIEKASPVAVGIGLLIGFIIVFRILAYLALKFMNIDHKPKQSFWLRQQ